MFRKLPDISEENQTKFGSEKFPICNLFCSDGNRIFFVSDFWNSDERRTHYCKGGRKFVARQTFDLSIYVSIFLPLLITTNVFCEMLIYIALHTLLLSPLINQPTNVTSNVLSNFSSAFVSQALKAFASWSFSLKTWHLHLSENNSPKKSEIVFHPRHEFCFQLWFFSWNQ